MHKREGEREKSNEKKKIKSLNEIGKEGIMTGEEFGERIET